MCDNESRYTRNDQKQLSRIIKELIINRINKVLQNSIYLFCNIINVFIITFIKFKASLLNKSIHFYMFFSWKVFISDKMNCTN